MLLLSSQCKPSVCSVVKTKGIVAKSRISERELNKKKLEKVMDWRMINKSEGKGARTIQ